MALKDELLGMVNDRGIWQQIGKHLAEGMAQSGNASSFTSSNPTGRTEGRAGGRGSGESLAEERKALVDEIKARQHEHKYANQISKSFSGLNKSLRESVDDIEKHRRAALGVSKVLDEEWGRALRSASEGIRSEQNLINNLNALLDEEIETMEDVIKVKQRHAAIEKRIFDKNAIVSEKTRKEYNKLTDALTDATFGVKAWQESLSEKFNQTVRGIFSFDAALANASIALTQLYNDMKQQLRFGSQLGYFQNQLQAMMAGVDPGAMTEMLGQSRQASLTFGSMNEYLEETRSQQYKYFNQIGDLTESLRFTTDSMQQLGRMGIRPSAEAMDQMAGSFRVLNKIAGITSDQFTSMMEATMNDVDVQTRLRVANEAQRRAIIAGINKQIEMNVAMGLTAEQAQAAALAMGKIAGGGARERFKRAAQMQMAFSAMGVEGGARAADLVRKGQARLSPGERAELEELTTRLTEKSTAAKGGSFQTEFLRDTILDKTGLNQYFGEDSPLNKQLAEGLRANKTVLEEIRDSIRDNMNLIEKGMMWTQKIGNFIVNGALGKLLMSAVQLIGTYIIARGGLRALGALGRGLGGAGAGAALMQAGRGALGTAGRMATSAARFAGPAAAVGGAGYLGYQAGGKIYENVGDKDWFTSGADTVFGAFDHIAQLWSDEAAERIKNQEQQEQANRELIDPAKKTAENSDRQLTQSELTNELLRTLVEVNSGSLGATEAARRISDLQSGQQFMTVPGT